jgi:hypothetical protein
MLLVPLLTGFCGFLFLYLGLFLVLSFFTEANVVARPVIGFSMHPLCSNIFFTCFFGLFILQRFPSN